MQVYLTLSRIGFRVQSKRGCRRNTQLLLCPQRGLAPGPARHQNVQMLGSSSQLSRSVDSKFVDLITYVELRANCIYLKGSTVFFLLRS